VKKLFGFFMIAVAVVVMSTPASAADSIKVITLRKGKGLMFRHELLSVEDSPAEAYVIQSGSSWKLFFRFSLYGDYAKFDTHYNELVSLNGGTLSFDGDSFIKARRSIVNRTAVTSIYHYAGEFNAKEKYEYWKSVEGILSDTPIQVRFITTWYDFNDYRDHSKVLYSTLSKEQSQAILKMIKFWYREGRI